MLLCYFYNHDIIRDIVGLAPCNIFDGPRARLACARCSCIRARDVRRHRNSLPLIVSIDFKSNSAGPVFIIHHAACNDAAVCVDVMVDGCANALLEFLVRVPVYFHFVFTREAGRLESPSMSPRCSTFYIEKKV